MHRTCTYRYQFKFPIVEAKHCIKSLGNAPPPLQPHTGVGLNIDGSETPKNLVFQIFIRFWARFQDFSNKIDLFVSEF